LKLFRGEEHQRRRKQNEHTSNTFSLKKAAICIVLFLIQATVRIRDLKIASTTKATILAAAKYLHANKAATIVLSISHKRNPAKYPLKCL
jgi:phosphopantetheinyl transferase (holo-ACP synthase)